MRRYLKVVVFAGVLMPACDAFVCSQERMKAMAPAEGQGK